MPVMDNAGGLPVGGVELTRPLASDGATLWQLARDSGNLDLNSSYAYVLWCRDFADTTVVARTSEGPVGFVIGYRRPEAPETVFVWQVAVAEVQRGNRVASVMLDELMHRLGDRGVQFLETTITDDNAASIALFTRAAYRWGAPLRRSDLFPAALFPGMHDPEFLYRIGPIPRNS